jgi:hypothetical protein
LPTPTSFPFAVSRRRSPSRHFFASPPEIFRETTSLKRCSQLRQQLHSVLLSCFFYRRSFAKAISLLPLRNCMETLCRRSTPYCCNPSPFEVLTTFFFVNLFDIELDDRDGLELELDKKMTSLGAAALPQHRLRSSVTLDLFSSTARLLACRISASSTRHVTSCSNLASAVHKTLSRRRLHSPSQFLDGGSCLATLSQHLLTFCSQIFFLV